MATKISQQREAVNLSSPDNKDNGKKPGFGTKIKAVLSFLDRHAWLQCIILGILGNLTVESLSRHSLIKGLVHMFTSPAVFLFNALIITVCLSLCTLFRHRYQLMLCFGVLFIGFGITNAVILAMRVTPFEWVDLQIVKLSLLKVYLEPWQVLVIVAAFAAAVAGVVIFFIKGPKTTVKLLKNAIATVVFAAVLFASLFLFRSTGILLSDHVKNIHNAYYDYGFNYCFMCSVFDVGIDKPSQYDKSDINKITTEINDAAQNAGATANDDVNVIFLQLESFFDVNHLSDVSYSEDPLPNFTRLQKEYSSGYITVPSIGGGTANTEFEIISQMSLNYFGVGEYPYKTILKKHPSDSICQDLERLGYKSHAIHNNTAVFYDRNIVFKNLGFDTFTSIEYMDAKEFTPTGWAKDKVLTGCITDALDSTEGPDLVYTITVQGHGKYLSSNDTDPKVKVTGIENESTRQSFEYYVNQINEVDQFVGELLETLEARDEKTVVVIYGDHLPGFDFSADQLTGGDLYQTEYVIWDNIGLQKQDGDCIAYQLSSKVLGMLGINEGLLTRLHQNFQGTKNYQKWLEVLEYDMLYGEKYAWGGKDGYLYETKETKMGVKDITLDGVVENAEEQSVTVTGSNFNSYSTVFINDKKYSTEKIDDKTLYVRGVTLSPGDRVAVSQVDDENTRLSTTATYLIGGSTAGSTSASTDSIIYRKYGFRVTTAYAIIAVAAAVIAVAVMITVISVRKRRR